MSQHLGVSSPSKIISPLSRSPSQRTEKSTRSTYTQSTGTELFAPSAQSLRIPYAKKKHTKKKKSILAATAVEKEVPPKSKDPSRLTSTTDVLNRPPLVIEEIHSGECQMYNYPASPTPGCCNCFGCCYGCCYRRSGNMPRMKEGKWKKIRLVLTNDSTLAVFRATGKKPPLDSLVEVPLAEVVDFIAYGEFTHSIPGRPKDIQNEALILVIPEEPRVNGPSHWLQFDSDSELNAWLLAICSVLPLPTAPGAVSRGDPSTDHSMYHSVISPGVTFKGHHTSTNTAVSPRSYNHSSIASSLNDVYSTSLSIKVDTGVDLLARYQREHGGFKSTNMRCSIVALQGK